MRNISAADANRHFSRILRDVQAGQTVTVTSRGTPVATIRPTGAGSPNQWQAKQALLARLRGQATAGISWSRDELYDDGTPA
ncbi:type II toxin-antitoxin system Phd/YefM family antitoxin [Magnetospirillum molischianum]|uniref:Antitoxin n=1 Tax=Magnetospirillum molischianum DSM 120 TaxID=1150626 RepID=H8FWM7_MAGML|nr:type II toxin-antitoxin system prevent-host-death family antitoxin [Magnetospirillum molischianum]CCG42765.1 Prevent-host-death family protein [Magnetospirillum molischianum DSM 120]